MGYDLEGVDKDRVNSAGLWDYIQGSGTDIAAVRQKKLGGERGDVEDPGMVLPPVGHTDCGDDGKTYGGRDVGISCGSGGAKRIRLIPHIVLHLNTKGIHRVTGDVLPHL